MSTQFMVMFDNHLEDVTPLVRFLDGIHATRSDTHEPLRVVVPAAGSQPELAITTLIEYWHRWNGVRVLGMHYTRVYEFAADANIELYSPYFAGPDRQMYYRATPGNRPHMHVVDRSFARIGAAYEAVRPHAIITQVTSGSMLVACEYQVGMGASADYTHRLIMQTEIPLFAMPNRYQPWVNGNLVPYNRIAAMQRFDHPIHEMPRAVKPAAQVVVMERIAGAVARVLRQINSARDGKGLTVQVGIGVLPDFIVGMTTDVITRVYSEVITNTMRRLPANTQITGTLLLGDAELYEWANGNRYVDLLDVEKTNSSIAAAQLRLVSIIQAMKVTLDGSTIVGVGKRHSGPGGAPDFGHSPGATHFIVLPAARYDNDGNPIDSNIVLGADALDFKILNGFDRPEYLVTEFGVARLTPHIREDGTVFMGDAEEVAEAIISVAHPDYRDRLRAEAASARITASSRVLPAVA